MLYYTCLTMLQSRDFKFAKKLFTLIGGNFFVGSNKEKQKLALYTNVKRLNKYFAY